MSRNDMSATEFSAALFAEAPESIQTAWSECEKLRKAISKNNVMKKSISKRLRHNDREAERFREELATKISGEERLQLMELQYQVGKLELANMELEQHRIVHESLMKGKELTIQKLQLQVAVRDKIIQRQLQTLQAHGLDQSAVARGIALVEDAVLREIVVAPLSSKATVSPAPSRGAWMGEQSPKLLKEGNERTPKQPHTPIHDLSKPMGKGHADAHRFTVDYGERVADDDQGTLSPMDSDTSFT
jgi:hypothetical protein